MSNSDYYNAINLKLKNQSDFNQEHRNIARQRVGLAQKLNHNFDQNFNQFYDSNAELNQSIENKTRLIEINNDAHDDKNNIIFILSHFLYLILFMVFLFMAGRLGLFNARNLPYFYAVSLSGYLIYIYYKVYYQDYTIGEYRAKKFADDSTSSIFRQVLRDILPNYMTRDRCPSGCRPPKPRDNGDLSGEGIIRDMETDSTLNFWKRGDIMMEQCSVYQPTNEEKKMYHDQFGIMLNDRVLKCPLKRPVINPRTRQMTDYMLMNQPEPWYGAGGEMTEYHCKWNGGMAGPIGEQGAEFTSQIPCKYFPGYAQAPLEKNDG